VPSQYPIPTPRAVQEVLEGLIASEVRVAVKELDDPARDTTGAFADYITDGDELALLCFASHDLVNSVGGALLEVGPSVTAESSAKALLHEGCLDGFREVVNVLSAAFNSDHTPHLRLREVRELPGELTKDLKQLWRSPRARRSYRVSVSEYGGGALILYAS
jgi:hypothetical protein